MTTVTLPQPPYVSGGEHEHGHLEELRKDPIGLMRRVHDECGAVGSFNLAGRRVVLLSGADVNEWYFRSPDEVLDQGAAYPFMTPIFGKGVVFDAPPERRAEMLKNQSLRGPQMRGHAEVIAAEVQRMVAGWDSERQIDLLDFFAELTIYTSSACLIGKKFREQLDGRFAELYHDLEQGTDALAYVDPYAPIESFRRRDAARVELVKLVEAIMATRAGEDAPAGDPDLLDLLMSVTDDGKPRFTADEITGMFIGTMFAGHHTTSGTAAWTLIELLRHPDEMAAVIAELDELYADGSEVSFQALREIPRLEAAIKEALRLHPPLILLLRVATEDLEVGGYAVRQGDLVAATPAISNRLTPDFPDADAFDPARYLDPRREDDTNPWTWIPFGGGKHRCVGAAFALMQLKAIFSILLRDFSWEMAQPSESYRNDHSKMVVQLQQPCAVNVRPRDAR
ncbi:MAG TPA: cytochrome P450 [Mycobacteriales bacterium]|nr:cytochrome P450 [Mycobacteriales bacterium]